MHDKFVTTARNSIREFKDDLESVDDNVVCQRQAAEKFRPTYDGIFCTFGDDIPRPRGSVRSMTQNVDRYNGMKHAQSISLASSLLNSGSGYMSFKSRFAGGK